MECVAVVLVPTLLCTLTALPSLWHAYLHAHTHTEGGLYLTSFIIFSCLNQSAFHYSYNTAFHFLNVQFNIYLPLRFLPFSRLTQSCTLLEFHHNILLVFHFLNMSLFI